jgi:hypothetical protein
VNVAFIRELGMVMHDVPVSASITARRTAQAGASAVRDPRGIMASRAKQRFGPRRLIVSGRMGETDADKRE